MTNLLLVLPDFDVSPYSHIVPSLERALVCTADLVTLDPLHVAKRAHVPPTEVKKLQHALLTSLHADLAPALDITAPPLHPAWSTVSTLDAPLDAALAGGFARGHLTEVVGESAAGKTQFLLTLLLSAQLPASGAGADVERDTATATATAPTHPTSALYISTEAPLQTKRLTQILETHPRLAHLPPTRRPSLSRVHSTHIHDLEAQDHILRYQVPVAIRKHNVSLLIIDSIAANYRAEFDKGGKGKRSAEALAHRSAQLATTGVLLRRLAREHNIAVVVANQVADRFTTADPSWLHSTQQSTQNSRPRTPPQHAPLSAPPSRPPVVLSTDDPLALDHQQRFFTGWGDDPSVTDLKTPSLGLTWTNQLSARVALLKQPIYEERVYAPGEDRNVIGWRRSCKAVFSAWCADCQVPFEIWEGGIRTLKPRDSSEPE